MADPDHDRPVGAVARGPGVAEARRCAGLEGDPPIAQCHRQRCEAFGQRRVGQHVGDIPGGGRADQLHRFRFRAIAAHDRRRKLAAIGETGIEPRHLERRDRGAAQRHAELAPASPGGRPGATPALRRVEMKRCGPDLLQRQHGRYVQRLLQGPAHGDGADMLAVEVARQPVAEAHRHVLDQRLRMERPVVERHGVDQGLQRRAGRAVGTHQVDLAGAAEEVASRPARPRRRRCDCRSRPGRSAPGRRTGRARRRRAGRARSAARSARSSERSRRATGRPATPPDAAPASAWRALRSGTGRLTALSNSTWSMMACSNPRISTRSRAACADLPARSGRRRLGRLRNGDQQGRLGGGELLAAPCRNRRRRRRARLRDCRPSAPGSGRSPAPRAWSSAIRAAARAPTRSPW